MKKINKHGGRWRKSYQQGIRDGLEQNDFCPYACGSKDWEWWWNGYWCGIDSRK